MNAQQVGTDKRDGHTFYQFQPAVSGTKSQKRLQSFLAANQTDQCQNVSSTFFGTNIWSDQYFCLICSHFFRKETAYFCPKIQTASIMQKRVSERFFATLEISGNFRGRSHNSYSTFNSYHIFENFRLQ